MMKARIIEHRLSSRYRLRAFHSRGDHYEPDVSLEECDPHVSDGWVEVTSDYPPLRVRSRMFYDVESITRLDDVKLNDDELPGEPFKLHFDNGGSLTVHNTIIAETEAEATPVS
jgi:hypothetical protein